MRLLETPWREAGLLLATLALLGCGQRAQDAGKIADARSPSDTLVATAVLEPRATDVRLPPRIGRLQAREHRALAFEVAGRLVSRAETGDHVQEGEVLAVLDRALEEAKHRRARLHLGQAVRELGRIRGLRESNAASRKALDAAETALALRKTELEISAEELARRTLVAPYQGVIGETTYEAGEVVSPGSVLLRLLDLSSLALEIGVPGKEITAVERDARVEVELPEAIDRSGRVTTHEGRVDQIAPAPEVGEHLYEVQVIVPNPGGRLRPGMPARARIVTHTLEQALHIPLELVVERGEQRVVFFAVDGRARAVGVGDATLDGDRLLLPAGATPYRELVVRGHRDLREGASLRVDDTVLARLAEQPERGHGR